MRRADETEITDLTRGVYRRIYAGYLKGKRINGVSLQAEAWFWRVHAVADDFGNADGDPRLCRDATAGRREVTTGQVSQWLDELVQANLLKRYESTGECYVHIVGFVTSQPAGKNGKRIRRCPPSPYDEPADDTTDADPATGESRGIQVNPDSSSASDNDTENDTEESISTEPGKPAPVVEVAVDPESVAYPEFPTVGREDQPRTWRLTGEFLRELQGMFPGVDVTHESRRAHGWVKCNMGRRKTARGMKKFLFDWMTRNQNRLGPTAGRNGGGNGRPSILPKDEWVKGDYRG